MDTQAQLREDIQKLERCLAEKKARINDELQAVMFIERLLEFKKGKLKHSIEENGNEAADV